MRIFITGITGTLGTALTELLVEDGHEIVGYSRCELKQQEFLRHPKITLYLGDVRNRSRLVEATRGCDIIFHLAALKHVDKMEENPEECIATNVLGTENVLHAQRVHGIPRVVLASTDKAVYPINAYGMSKALAEKLVGRNPNNVICRYGNVLGSRGSVLPKFIDQLQRDRTIHITDRKMTRFWIPVQDAAAFVLLASQKVEGGLYIPKMKAYPVVKLASLVGKVIKEEALSVVEIGMRPGEKLHEHLRRPEEGGEVISSDSDIWFKPKELETMLKGIIEKYI